MKIHTSLCLTAALLIGSLKAFSQYPTIPKAVKDSAEAAIELLEKPSKEAWEKARLIVAEEEKQGKPFIPWAAKPSDLPQAKIPAFPGAEGGGMYSFGGRGGKVIVVTNLEDSGPGSFRWACEQGGARTIVFNVAGIIQLKTPVNINAPYITIAGQSAPGDGVCIAGESVLINTHDVVIRFMRFRRGATDVHRRDDALGGNAVGNLIFDHVSASWGLDENFSMYRHVYDRSGKNLKLPTVNITIQNSIFSECLDTYNHAFGSTIGGLNTLFARNLWSSNISRNPSVGMYGDFNFVNNVVFNWWNRSADGGDHRSYYNFINNYYKPGPITPAGEPISYRILKPESGRDQAYKNTFGKAFVDGNIIEGNTKVTADNWNGGVQPDVKNQDSMNASIKAKKPIDLSPVGVIPAADAYAFVLKNVGAVLPKRDAVDERIVQSTKTGEVKYAADAKPFHGQYVKRRLPEDSYKKGIVTHPQQVGGYPEYKGTPYKDSDNDGIPDEYEIKNGLNPNDASDSPKIAINGYSNIENYLNSLVPTEIVLPKAGKKLKSDKSGETWDYKL
ncbi:polysaccharide lyase [Polluticaenibacter yanchengensis]|uniref:Thrombospondin type 3 repeat-containing protein n=1 Tax=Polluticaenibacter yanchengensis TaxID=3014562 RepID=A0ABT4ULN4_9BACT|nr:thrombospondin type 3 repeat-containing protein [Chitinophagaceae bacterium LY-5]